MGMKMEGMDSSHQVWPLDSRRGGSFSLQPEETLHPRRFVPIQGILWCSCLMWTRVPARPLAIHTLLLLTPEPGSGLGFGGWAGGGRFNGVARVRLRCMPGGHGIPL